MVEGFLTLHPLGWSGTITALLCGAVIGLERQVNGKPVGIRTSSLICFGTFIFVALSKSVASNITDPSRIIGQVVTGVGFLGAGVMLSRDGFIHGVTSAAAIWILAALGVVVAHEYYLSAIIISFLTVIILVGVDLLEDTFKGMQKGIYTKLRQKETPDNKDKTPPTDKVN